MGRTTKKPSVIFRNVLKQAEEQLFLAARAAKNFKHRGIRGAERAEAVRSFLSSHLPKVFATAKGEIIDYQDTQSGEIDLCVYDAATSSPMQAPGDSALIPAEALYAVVEVKSVLTRAELKKCVAAAQKVRALKPFKRQFGPPQTKGAASKHHRCMYFVFAYRSDLSLKNWAQREFDRLKHATTTAGCELDVIDRILVLDRGMIRPQAAAAILRDESKGIFLEFYIHLLNFLMRERKKRPVIDWTAYTSKARWEKLT